jgi:exportin-2 (importin alpha re-exporter)
LRFRDVDEELFADNFVEYIRRDIEGSDTDTRRRMACELLKALTTKFQRAVTQAVSGYVSSLLTEYAASPDAAWKQKDCAIYLVIALTVRGKSDAKGATATNELVNIGDFFAAHILPELQAPPKAGQPVLKADALKFVTTFRQQIPKAACLTLLPSVGALLASENNVVHTYAALCIERMLTVRDGGAVRFNAADVLPMRDALLGSLFGALTLPESSENDYVMKAIMRVIAVLGPECVPVAMLCVERLAATVMVLAQNPRNPLFAHYTFETLALLVRHTAALPELAPKLEALVFPPFQAVLQADVQEFAPYVFQVLAQMLECRPAPLPPHYMQLFPPLLSPQLWERQGNVPALVRLLEAYLTRAPVELVHGNHLTGVLGVFQKLNASRAHDHEGFYILNALVEHLDVAAWQVHLPALWSLLLQRLQHSRTPKYTRSFCMFMSLLLARQGPAWTAQGLELVQPGLFAMLVEQIWLPGLSGISGDTERKLAAVAACKVATDFPPLAADGAQALWARLVEQAVALLTEEEDGTAAADADADADEEAVAAATAAGGVAGAAYARLASASRPEREPVPEVRTAKQFLATSLARMAQQQPGRLAPRIAAGLGPGYQSSLAAMCAAAGVSLV